MHVWALGLSCETPGAPPDRAAGARTRQPENSKRAHFRAPALQTPPKFHEKTSQRGKERTNFAAGEGKKKREILGPPPFGPPPFEPPPFRAPPFAPPPFGPPHPSNPPPFETPPPLRNPTFLHPPTPTQNTQKKLEQLISKNPGQKQHRCVCVVCVVCAVCVCCVCVCVLCVCVCCVCCCVLVCLCVCVFGLCGPPFRGTALQPDRPPPDHLNTTTPKHLNT